MTNEQKPKLPSAEKLNEFVEMRTEGSYYYPLFKFFADEHGLILLDSDIQEIINQVEKFQSKSVEKREEKTAEEDVENFIQNEFMYSDLEMNRWKEEISHSIYCTFNDIVSLFAKYKSQSLNEVKGYSGNAINAKELLIWITNTYGAIERSPEAFTANKIKEKIFAMLQSLQSKTDVEDEQELWDGIKKDYVDYSESEFDAGNDYLPLIEYLKSKFTIQRKHP